MDPVNPASEPPAGKPAQPAPVPATRRRWMRRIGWAAAIFVVCSGLMMGGAEYYTGRPEFCRSCHIMEPYYQSWSRDIHGAKLGVRCVDCHYAPGERLTFHAKFKGLSQATSYFSGRAGGSRPRAHLNDASCLTSACHGDGKYIDKKILIGEVRSEKRYVAGKTVEVQRTPTVTFVHAKHIKVTDRLKQTGEQVEKLESSLKAALPEGLFTLVEGITIAVQPLPDREAKLGQLLKDKGLARLEPDALEYARAVDLELRFKQLDGLTCSACHSYDPSSSQHFAVDRQTCYACHFNKQAFNTGTGRCLNCHAPPSRQILVHAAPTTQGAQQSIMDHQDILNRNIDCSSCHLDVVQAPAPVTTRECAHCHDRVSYLEKFETRTMRDVEEYHRLHVHAQRARCPDCHGGVSHELIEPTLVATSSGFLKPVLQECQHCHPNHHEEQVELLMGVGGKDSGVPMPNAMFGSRVNCRACHKQAGTDFKGDPLIQATATTCVACHEQKYGDLLKQWINEVSAYLKESEKALESVKQRAAQARAAGTKVPARVDDLIAQAEYNIKMIRKGNGIHNRNYATHLLDLSDESLRAAVSLLGSAGGTATSTRPQ
jgi:nitrate/TMAO reductase-like tetraheme cytochrome c subunit